MGLIADSKYSGVVGVNSHMIETNSGTLGYQIPIQWTEGDTSFTIWLTDKNRKNALKCFAALGVTEEQLSDQSFVEYKLALAIQGKEISFGTALNDYNGKQTVQVSWIGRKGTPADGLSKAAAGFFGKKPVTTELDGDPITDADVPF